MTFEDTSFMISSVDFSSGLMRDDFHHHQDYEMIYIIDGQIEMEIEGKLYRAGRDSLLFITNLENHWVKSVTEPYLRYCITLRPLICDRYLTNPDLLGILKNHARDFVHLANVSSIRPTVTALFEKLLHCSPDAPYANELAVCYITEILISICRTNPLQFRVSDIPCKELILEIQKYMDQHYGEDIRIAELAKDFGISSCYLSHKFKELSGFSPKQYLTSVRLKNAANALYASRLSVSQVAESCGFGDVSNFIKLFKAEYGMTPANYKNSTLHFGASHYSSARKTAADIG